MVTNEIISCTAHGHALQPWTGPAAFVHLVPLLWILLSNCPMFLQVAEPWLAAEFNRELTYRTLNLYRFISCVTPKQAPAQLALVCSVERLFMQHWLQMQTSCMQRWHENNLLYWYLWNMVVTVHCMYIGAQSDARCEGMGRGGAWHDGAHW